MGDLTPIPCKPVGLVNRLIFTCPGYSALFPAAFAVGCCFSRPRAPREISWGYLRVCPGFTLQSDWRAALRKAGRTALSERYQGETLNFETPGAFFGRLAERRWALVQTIPGAGQLSVRELARRVERDVKRVHEDVTGLTELGLIERTERGGVSCPFEDIHIDLRLRRAA